VPLTSRITRLFLGTQVQCCQCHDHPFTAGLKQNHFWRVNAFLRQVERDGTPPVAGTGMMMTYTTLTLKDNAGANADAMIYFEQRNGVVRPAKAEFLPSGEEKKARRLSTGAAARAEPNGRRIELA